MTWYRNFAKLICRWWKPDSWRRVKSRTPKNKQDSILKTRKLDCNRWSQRYDCPARGKKSRKLNTKANHLREHETYRAKNVDRTPNKILLIPQKIRSRGTDNKNGPLFYTIAPLANIRPKQFIVDTGSQLTLIAKSKSNKTKTIKPRTVNYRNMNDNIIKLDGITTVNIERAGTEK